MVGALLVTVLVILGFVVFRSCVRSDLAVQPDHVDYRSEVGFAQRSGVRLAYPASLPRGWYATNVDYTPGTPPTLLISMLTSDRQYAGFVQSPSSAAQVLTTYVDAQPTAGDPVTLDSGPVRQWDTWTDAGGDTALVARWPDQTLMVFGSATQAELETLASSLTDERLGAAGSSPSGSTSPGSPVSPSPSSSSPT
jgi:hypothetical protein